eukprot:scaffold2791_cov154-Amphora_coffeaeformis.AAC.2
MHGVRSIRNTQRSKTRKNLGQDKIIRHSGATKDLDGTIHYAIRHGGDGNLDGGNLIACLARAHIVQGRRT